jgi:hypothetical protein
MVSDSLARHRLLAANSHCHSCFILWQLVKDDPARHYWIIVLSTAELYGGWMVSVRSIDEIRREELRPQ